MKIKAVSFNIRCKDDVNGNSVKERAPRLAKIMEEYDADVIGFQEFTPLWTRHINKHFRERYEFFNKYRDVGWRESAPILWKKDKFDCLKRGYFWLSDTPEKMSGGWDSIGHNRICLYVLLQDKKDGKIFAFFNTHFGFGEENQIKSVRLIGRYVEKFSNYPTFITGDFNMIPSSAPYAEAVKNFTDVNEVTVKDRRSTYHGYDLQNTFNEHIDYCFIDKKITPISFKIIDELVEGKFPSDHYGLYAELEI
ncbi:MAG: endonuclease/exonuclease/phosphatase family protein [Clostridia bacterium]|nr:endonuclease/exonuclease/phosphatase family protein [Clostridia bacterium]